MRAFVRLLIILVLVFQPLGMSAQGPVIKPTPAAGTRLPAPKNITVTQEADGRIRVVWGAVAGATAYNVVRSVPGIDAMRALSPNPTDTVFFDSDVVAGGTYYYQIAAINEGGKPGLKAGAIPVKAVRSAINTGGNEGGSVTPKPPTNVVAAMNQTLRAIELTWEYGGRPGLYFQTEILEVTNPPRPWSQADRLGPSRPSQDAGHARFNFVDERPEGTQYKFRVSAIDSATGARSPPTESNVVAVAHGSASCSTGKADENVGAGGGVVGVHTGATLSVRVGASAYLGNVYAAPNHWVSFDPHIAEVSIDGGLTGRSAGCAQVLGIGRSGGSINVYLVVVTVQP